MQKETDNIDHDSVVYHKGFEAGKEHQHSSPETKEIISQLKNDMNLIHEQLSGEFGVIAILRRIEAQTIKTNGRVTKQERWSYGLTTAWGIGAGLIVFFIVYIALPSYKELVSSVTTLKDKVTAHVASDSKSFNNLNK